MHVSRHIAVQICELENVYVMLLPEQAQCKRDLETDEHQKERDELEWDK